MEAQRRPLSRPLRGLVLGPRRSLLRRERADRRGRGREALAAGHPGRMDGRGELVLPPLEVSAAAARALRSAAGLHPPESRRNEVLRFVEGGLRDLSASRARASTGAFRCRAAPGHVMYVWVDALTNYITGLGYPDDTRAVARYWPADLHLIGKDIVRFHAVYWPAFLMSAGLRCRSRCSATASCSAAARRCRRASATSSTRWSWPTASGSMRCAISCCARSASARTAATAPRRSSTAPMPSSRTASAISRSALCR